MNDIRVSVEYHLKFEEEGEVFPVYASEDGRLFVESMESRRARNYPRSFKVPEKSLRGKQGSLESNLEGYRNSVALYFALKDLQEGKASLIAISTDNFV